MHRCQVASDHEALWAANGPATMVFHTSLLGRRSSGLPANEASAPPLGRARNTHSQLLMPASAPPPAAHVGTNGNTVKKALGACENGAPRLLHGRWDLGGDIVPQQAPGVHVAVHVHVSPVHFLRQT